MGQGEHPPPLAEDDDLAPCSSTICRTSCRSSISLGAKRLLSKVSSGARPRIVGHILLEVELNQAIGDNPLGRQQLHEPEKLGLGQRPLERDHHEPDNRLVEFVVRGHLLFRHLDWHPGVGSRDGSWSSTSWRIRRTMQCRSRSRIVSRLRAPTTSRRPSARVACRDASRHLGSSAMSSTHSTTDASSSIRFSIGVPVKTRR